jgi:uncharacterized protein (DUF58 family)
MALETKEEVVLFLEANRKMFVGKVGFKHFAEQLSDVITFIELLADENERLKGGSLD